MYLQAALQAGSRILYAASTCSLFIWSGRTFVAQAQAFFSNSARGAMPKHNGYWSVSTVQYNAAILHGSHIDSWRQRLAGKNQSCPKFLKNKQTSKLRTSLRRNTDDPGRASPRRSTILAPYFTCCYATIYFWRRDIDSSSARDRSRDCKTTQVCLSRRSFQFVCHGTWSFCRIQRAKWTVSEPNGRRTDGQQDRRGSESLPVLRRLDSSACFVVCWLISMRKKKCFSHCRYSTNHQK